MKKILFAFVSAIVCFSSCKKKGVDNATPTPSVDSQAYMLSNVQDISFANNTTFPWTIPVEWKSGVQQRVTVSVAGLPAGVIATPDTISGLASFTPTFFIKARHAVPGKYLISVYATSASLGTRKYDMNLTVGPAGSCVNEFVGVYANTNSTVNDTTYGTYSATIANVEPYKIKLTCTYCKAEYSNVRVTIDCDKGEFSIPKQFAYLGWADSAYIEGSGKLIDSNMVVLKYAYMTTFDSVWRNYTDTLRK